MNLMLMPSKWEQSGKLGFPRAVRSRNIRTGRRVRRIMQRRKTAWFRRPYGKAQCVSAKDRRLNGRIPGDCPFLGKANRTLP